MQEIHPDRFWLGNALTMRDPKSLFDVGIAAVVDLAIEEPPAQLPRQLTYVRIPLNDGGGNAPSLLVHAVQMTLDLLRSETPTLIACSAGISRSPTIASFALAAFLDEDPDQMLDNIAALTPTGIHRILWSDVADVFPKVRR